MIDIRTDPKNPMGGVAILSVGAGQLPGTEVLVSVLDKFRGHYLGASGFQPHKFEFGPYPVEQAEGASFIRVGAEIVNQVEEYANLRLTVGPVEADVSWPDDIMPLPGAPKLGKVFVAPDPEAAPEAPKNTLNRDVPPTPAPEAEPEPQPEPVIPTPDPIPEPGPSPVETEKNSRGMPIVIWLAPLVLGALAAGGYYWFSQQQGAPAPVVAVEPPAEVTTDPCGLADLQALFGQDVPAGLAQLNSCGSDITADTALLLIESGLRGGNAQAAALMGKLYDSVANDPIETATGLSFGEDLKNAVRYYKTAAYGGDAEAHDLLTNACERLQGETNTLSQGAFTDYCGE